MTFAIRGRLGPVTFANPRNVPGSDPSGEVNGYQPPAYHCIVTAGAWARSLRGVYMVASHTSCIGHVSRLARGHLGPQGTALGAETWSKIRRD